MKRVGNLIAQDCGRFPTLEESQPIARLQPLGSTKCSCSSGAANFRPCRAKISLRARNSVCRSIFSSPLRL